MKKEEKYFNDGLGAYNNKNYDNAINYFNDLFQHCKIMFFLKITKKFYFNLSKYYLYYLYKIACF